MKKQHLCVKIDFNTIQGGFELFRSDKQTLAFSQINFFQFQESENGAELSGEESGDQPRFCLLLLRTDEDFGRSG